MSAAADTGALEAHRRDLFALCYRMTGSAADAEDLVQETFARAVARPPPDRTRPWRPWLVRVATNLARDHLRRRRRRSYVGPWLPEPLETEALLPRLDEPESTAGRYELLESVSYAFLLALEALTPLQRAVLVLCDVLDYEAAEAAEALDTTAGAVRTTLHRARRRMVAYDARRTVPTPAVVEATRATLERFLLYMAAGDVEGMEALLAEDVVAVNDGGGIYAAARVPVRGRGRVARFHRKLVRKGMALTHATLLPLNGLPAVWAAYPEDPERPHLAPRFAVLPVPDRDGRLRMLCTLVAPPKLRSLPPVPPLPAGDAVPLR